jgi:hypothetical protein
MIPASMFIYLASALSILPGGQFPMFRAFFVLIVCALVASAVSPVMADEAAPASEPAAETPQWTVWGAAQYALADDGAAIWIGGTGSILRWDKEHKTYRRYTAADGLPHIRVLTVAVDAEGNRWFGGDRGLSRLDAAENWTHIRLDAGLKLPASNFPPVT